MDIKKYITPLLIGSVIGASLSGILGYLMSLEIMIKTIMANSSTFKVLLGAIIGALCSWIIIYNKK